MSHKICAILYKLLTGTSPFINKAIHVLLIHTDLTAWMPMLVCALVVRKPLTTGFLASRPILCCIKSVLHCTCF